MFAKHARPLLVAAALASGGWSHADAASDAQPRRLWSAGSAEVRLKADTTTTGDRSDSQPWRPASAGSAEVRSKADATTAGRVSDSPRQAERPEIVIRAGDRVRATVRIGVVEAVVIAIAEQSGVAQQIIRVVNPDSRRAIRARVVAAGEVEVVNGR